MAERPLIGVPTITLEGDANGAPHPDSTAYAGVLNLGYRRKVSDKLSLLVTAQNVLDSLERTVVIDTPVLRDRTQFRPRNRAVFVGFVYNFARAAADRRPEPGFEFDTGAATATP